MPQDTDAGKAFGFLIEKDKLEKIRSVVSRNHREVISEFPVVNDVRLKVGEVRETERPDEK